MFEQNGNVKCELCEKEFGSISFSHLKTHGMKMEEYKVMFPNSPTVGTKLRAKRAEVSKGTMTKLWTSSRERMIKSSHTDKVNEQRKKTWLKKRVGKDLKELGIDPNILNA